MKVAVLVCEVRGSSELLAQAYPTAEQALAAGKKARETGKLGAVVVRAGLVLHSERPLPLMRFVAAVPPEPKRGRS